MTTLPTSITDASNLDVCDQHPQCQTNIEIFSDGSCIGNPGPGGWGAVTIWRAVNTGAVMKRAEASGCSPCHTTNVRMEMTAVCHALESLGAPTSQPITVRSDAKLIPNAMNAWLDNWKAKGWRKSDGKPVENRGLWERIERAAAGRDVTWAWVRGHSGCEFNDRADRLAYAASRKAERIGAAC